MVKFIQGIFISNDPKLMYAPTKTYVKVQTSTLNEELGQVEYIFSDKTGTLTCNFMEFKNICIDGISYGIYKRIITYFICIKKFKIRKNVYFQQIGLCPVLYFLIFFFLNSL